MSRNSIIVGALVLAALVTGVVYLTGDSTDETAAATPSELDKNAGPAPQGASSQSDETSAPPRPDSPSLPPDPRLEALQVSPDNGLIKFVVGGNGKVIAEIDQDPASLGFGKPSREYVYMGDKVVTLTAYRYTSDHVEITRTMVAYEPDGSVAAIRESTSYEKTAQKAR